ncbi:hypothetical protein RSAG8_02414, partial [Rhizoctonia solani AG-8 WAC10335]
MFYCGVQNIDKIDSEEPPEHGMSFTAFIR